MLVYHSSCDSLTVMLGCQAALPVDGVLLSLHGGYSVEGIDDGDGDILKACRKLVGPGV